MIDFNAVDVFKSIHAGYYAWVADTPFGIITHSQLCSRFAMSENATYNLMIDILRSGG